MGLWDSLKLLFGMLPEGVRAVFIEDRENRSYERLRSERVRAERGERGAVLAEQNAQAAEADAVMAQQKLAAAKRAIDKLNSETKKQEDEIALLNDEISGNRAALKEEKERVRALQTALHQENEKLGSYERMLARAKQMAKEQDNDIRGLHAALENNKMMLDVRTSELRVAQTFLSKVDPISHADILAILHRLNSEIFQLSALMTDEISFEGQEVIARVIQEPYDGTRAVVGTRMADFLLSMPHGENSAYVQMALQAAISYFVFRFFGTWNILIDGGHNGLLERIYQRMTANEATTVCGKWRALALRYLALDHVEDLAQLQHCLVRELCDILFTSGVNVQPPDLLYQVKQSYGDKISDILRLADTFRKATKEDVISTDYRLALPHYDETFIQDFMEDAERRGNAATPKNGAAQKVLCTIELGMWRVERNVGKDGSPEGVVEVLMLKPKVILVSLAEEVVRERMLVDAGAT